MIDRAGWAAVMVVGDEGGLLADHLRMEGVVCLGESADLGGATRRNPGAIVVGPSGEPSPGDVDELVDYLRGGGSAVLVRPGPAIRKALGMAGEPGTGWSKIDVPAMDGGRPVACQVIGLDRLEWKGKGSAAGSAIPCGAGRAFVIPFDLPATLYGLTHGSDVAPGKGGAEVPRVDFGRLVADDRLDEPQVDRLCGWLVGMIGRALEHPLPRLWYYPGGSKSALCVTHDTDNVDAGALKEIDGIDREAGVEATTFLRVVDGSPKAWRALAGAGVDLQFHPVYPVFHHPGRARAALQRAMRPRRAYKAFERRFVGVQKRLLEAACGHPMKGSRNHGLMWGSLEDLPAWIASWGVQFDSTMGSNLKTGYPYGTGRPYFLRSPAGRESRGVLEFPLHLMDHALWAEFGDCRGDGRAWARAAGFLEDAFAGHHALVVIDFHHYYLLSPDESRNSLPMYREILGLAESRSVLRRTMSWFDRYFRARMQARVEALTWREAEGLLQYRVVLPEMDGGDGYTHTVPSKHAERSLREVEVDGVPVETTRNRLWDAEQFLFETGGGEQVITISYAPASGGTGRRSRKRSR